MSEKKTPELRFAGFTDAWEQRKVGDRMYIKSRIGWQALTKSEYLTSGDYYLITGTDIDEQSHTVDLRKCFYVSEERYKMDDKIQVHEGDIIVTKDGTIGKVAMVRGLDKPATLNSHLFVLRDMSGELDNYYLLTVLNSHIFDEFVASTKTGSTLTGMPQKTFVEFTFPVPKYEEQKKIANYFQNLDTLITLHQRELKKLQTLKKSMLEKMFPKKGASVPQLRFHGFTDAWEQRKFSELTEIRSASRVHKEEWQSSGVPFYRSSDVMAALNGTENEKAFISEELYEKLSAVSGKLEKGDVLVTGGGSVGKPYIVPNNEPLYTKDADLLWIKNNKNLDPYFVYTFFFSPTFTDYLNSVSHVGTIAHYTITQLGETPITLPCVSEQQKIGDYFRNLDFLITLHQRELKKLQILKKSLLQKMFA